MGVDAHCGHRCTVLRARSTTDGYGQAVPTWAQHLDEQRCRLVVKTQRVPDGVLAERPVITTYALVVPGNADIRQGDRIIDVVDQDGAMVDAGPFRIEAALRRRSGSLHHTTYTLERYGGPDARDT